MAIISSNINNTDSHQVLGNQRFVDPKITNDELSPRKEDSLRPKSLVDFTGQDELKKLLRVSVAASQARREALDHLLFYGPPGLGKTTIALLLAEELGVKCRITSAPALERPRDIVGLLVNLQPRELLFVDEIHRLTKVAEELLYPAMEDLRLDLTVGRGSTARIRSITLNPFTLVGATTRPASISSPLRDRFGITYRFDFYNCLDLQKIVERAASLFGLSMTSDASMEISRRCRGTPRLANRLIRRVRDFATVKDQMQYIDLQLVSNALSLLQVDDRGLDATDRRLLKVLIDTHKGGPVGLENLAATLGEDPATIEFVVEPFLLQVGFLQRTPRGRMITEEGRRHILQNL